MATSGRTLTITQGGNRAIVNWQSFSIGAGEKTRILQPSAASAILNRVTGGDPSVLLGKLQSNGQVYLINPNGVMVGPNGVVDTRGFIASTLNVPDAAFMQGGALQFSGGSTATITNLGTIKSDSGDVALIALSTVNKGEISAPDGQAILAAGREVLYIPGDASDVVIKPAAAPGGVDNAGVIAAASVQLRAAGAPYALAVNNTGQISAGSVQHVGGHVVLAAGDGDVVSSGAVDAPGGDVAISGGRVALIGGAVDVSAPAGGGRVAITASDAIAVTADAAIKADATISGDGGVISLKAAKATQFAGAATATGGVRGGDGGKAEISGGALDYTGSVDLLAAKGKAGTLLFDPTDIIVEPGNAAAPSGVSGGLWGFADLSASTISVGAIAALLSSGNLELQASNSLTFDTAGTGSFATLSSTTSNTLTLTAPTISIGASISLPNGKLVMNWPDADAVTYSQTAQAVTSSSAAVITAHTLQIAGNYTTVELDGPVTTASLQFTQPNFFVSDITVNNAANAISAVSFDPGGTNDAVAVDVESSTAMTLAGGVDSANSATFVAGGDLTLLSGFSMDNPNSVTFASTGGVFDNLAGVGAITGANGKLRIYSSTNGVGSSGTTFDDGGLGGTATLQSGVSYPSNPDALDSVVEYFITTSATPLLTITADSFTRLYGQADPTFTASYSGGSGGGAGELTSLPSFRIFEGSDVNVGSYTIQPYGAASTVDLLRYVNGTLIVHQAPLTITANPASMTYGDAVPSFSSVITGFVNGDTSALVSGLTTTSNAGSSPGAGSYTITPSGAVVATPAGGVAPNYAITYQTDTLTVGRAPLTVSANAATTIYGAAIPAFSLNFSGFVNAGDASSVPGQFAAVTSAVAGSGVGTYAITLADPNPNGNYNVSYTGANLTITPAALTITPNLRRLYGAALPAVLPVTDFQGLVAGDTPASLTTQPTLSTSATVASNVSSYLITASGAVDPNYTISYAPGTLTVTPAPLLITANSASRDYGSANPVFSASYSGLVNGDAPSVATGLTFSTPATSASNVGSYTVTPSGASSPNYAISYANGTMTIDPVPLLVVPVGTGVAGKTLASAATITFNMSGFVNGDTAASLTTQPTYSTPADINSPSGLYTLLAFGASDPNYRIRYQPGVLSLRPQITLTLTALSLSSVYGSSTLSQTPGYTISGLSPSDPLSKVLASLPVVHVPTLDGRPAGRYLVTLTTGAVLDPEYNLVLQPGQLTITPAPLSITANSTGATQGDPVPTLTGTFNGLVGGDTPQTSGFSFTTGLTSTSNPGIFQINLAGSNPSYTVDFTPGQLTIASKATVIEVITTPVVTTDLSSEIHAADPPVISVIVPWGRDGLTFGPEGNHVLDIYASIITASGFPITTDEVAGMLNDPATSAAMIALLMPYLEADLTNIIAQPSSTWTYDQGLFVQQVLDFIDQQKKTAALNAENEYAAWFAATNAKQQAEINALAGPAQVDMEAIQSANPPIPPDYILNEAQAGVAMTGAQAIKFSAISSADNALAQLTPNDVASAVTESTIDSSKFLALTAKSVQAGMSLSSKAFSEVVRDASTAVGTSEQSVQAYLDEQRALRDAKNAKNTITKNVNNSAQPGSGETDTSGDTSGESAGTKSTTTTTETETTETDEGGGAASTSETNAEEIYQKGAYQAINERGNNLADAVNDTGKAVEKTSGAASGVESKAGETADIAETITDAAEDGASTATKVVGAVANAVEVGGAVLNVVATIVQIGLAADAYGKIGTYNAAFNDAVTKAQAPTTVNDLKAMSPAQLTTYLQNMLAGGSATPPVVAPPSTPAATYESL